MRAEWTTYTSPLGPLTLVECEAGPLVVEFPHRATDIKWAVRLQAAIPELHLSEGPCPATRAWLDDYFRGAPAPLSFPNHLKDWFELSPVQVAVYRALLKIPMGETRSYEEIARAVSLHPRQIGWLVAANHLAILVPCHRVVGKDGALVGYGGGLARKRWLLNHELRSAGVILT